MTFTDKQFEMLKEHAEWFFESVIHHSTIRSAPYYITEMVADVYESATGAKVNRNWSCSTCVMNLYRMVGFKYFEDKEERELQKKINEEDGNKEINIQGTGTSSIGDDKGCTKDGVDNKGRSAKDNANGNKEKNKKRVVKSKV